jgi:hypothetical protein
MVVRSTLDLALEYAAQGLRVFPCHEKNEPHAGRSSPYFIKALNFTSWATDASSDPARVRELFTQFPNAMIGIAMGYGRFALDIDIKTVDGWASLAALGIKIPVDAPRIRTASGGSHVIFLLPDFPIGNWVGQVGPGLDIKTDGGYVIGAGSVRDDGPYDWVVGSSYLDAVAAPPALVARLRELSEEKARRSEAPTGEQRSDPAASAWARAALDAELDKLSRVEPGTRNHALNATAFLLGQIVGGGYLDEGIVRARLYDIAVAIGLDNSEIPGTINSGLQNGKAKPRHPGERPGGNGYDAEGFTAADPEPEPPPGDGAPPVGEPAEPEDPNAAQVEQYRLVSERSIPRRPWLVAGFLLRRHLSVLYASSGTGKSIISLTIAVHLAIGRDFGRFKIPRPAKVAFLSVEEDKDEIDRRLAAICATYGVSQEALEGRLHKISLTAPQLLAWVKDPKSQRIEPTAKFTQMARLLADQGIEAVILDPFAELWEGEENNNMQVRTVASLLRDDLARELNMGVLLIHHVRKGTPEPGDVDAGRGAGSLNAAARIAFTMTKMTEAQASMLGIDGKHKGKIRLDRGKSSYGSDIDDTHWHAWHTVTLDNADPELGEPADQVGILKPWAPPGLFAGITFEAIDKLLDQIKTGPGDGERYTKSERAIERYVIPLAAETLGTSPQRAKEILKVWLRSKLLTEIDYISPSQRKTRKGLFVDESKRPNATTDTYD